ncbi:glycerophosphodiester phosphodiesterase [Alkalibacterium sp. MB6]|uniref:glycerophosphodiester phosphodiesterase n=1 Tax=Alkalibacterium sp. MB6 TaxID=2081965 RepID=UPI00137A6B00|nr:glycerophosphodiester phosphodiesterase [Alkalibacterium sp. MB6]
MNKWVKRVGIVLASIIAVWLVLFLFPLSSGEPVSFLEGDEGTMAIAHRGGSTLAPEGTLEAFRASDRLGVDMLEYDVHITADGELVVIHDETVDRTTDGTGRVNDMTLTDLQALDAGYHFEDKEGETPYRNQGVYIPSVDEVFEEFSHTRHLIELKDTNDDELYEDLMHEMYALIEKHQLHESVLIASFDHDMNLRFNEIAGGSVAIGAGEQEARQFVTYHKAFANLLYTPKADAFQLPTYQEGFNLADRKLLRGAKNRGQAVYYWTINDEETMRELIDLGAHGIMTDNPELLMSVIDDMASE